MSGLDGLSGRPSSRGRGFTLIELLTVIAIVAILSSIVFGLGRRVSESSRISRASSELATLSVVLESYRQVHGDYPQTDDAARMLQALIGRRDPLMNPMQGRASLDLAVFVTEMQRDPFMDDEVRLIDPWGQPYHYAYRTVVPWSNASYVLYTGGPDGIAATALLTGGYPDLGANENHDNIYANR